MHSIFWGGFGLVQGSLNSEMCPCFHGVILVVLSETKEDPLQLIYIFKTFLSYLCITVLSKTTVDSKKILSSQAPLLPTLKYRACVPGQTMQLFVLYL